MNNIILAGKEPICEVLPEPSMFSCNSAPGFLVTLVPKFKDSPTEESYPKWLPTIQSLFLRWVVSMYA